MPRISSYPTVAPAAGDLLIASDVSGTGNPTKTVTVQSVADFATPDTLEEVLTAGNTATNNIVLTGNFTGAGNITRTGDITLTGSAGVSGTLDVTGLSTLGSLDVTTSTVIGTTLGVTGLSTLATVDINGGNIDGTNIGVAVQGTGTFTTMTATTSILGTLGGNVNHNNFNSTNVDIDSGKIDGTQIGSAVAATGAFTTLTGTTVDGPIGSVTPASGQFTTLAASDSLRVDTNTLFVSNVTSRVGIGTTTAQSKLDVEGNVAIGATYSGTSAAPTNGLIVEGNVGIGTPSPNSTLELESSSGDIVIELDNNAAGSSNFQIQCGAGNARADLVLDNNLHITMKGQRVGIINTNPSHTFDVLGDGRITSDFIVGGDLTVDTDTLFVDATANRVGIGTTTPNNTLELESSSGDVIIEMDNNAAGSSNFQIQCGAGNARADLVLDNNLHLTMKGQRVGIINTNPSHTLDVLGDGRITSNFIVGGTTTITNELNLGAGVPGVAGQVITSSGAGSAPAWSDVEDVDLLKVHATPILTAAVGTLNSSPVVILPAPAAGIIRMPISFIIDWVVGTGAPSTNTDVSIYQINNTEKIGTCAALLAASGNAKMVIPISQPGVPSRCTVGEATATTIQVDSGDPNMTGSNSSMTVYALYRDITL